MPGQNSFTYPLNDEQQQKLKQYLESANLKTVSVPHTSIASEGPGFRVCLYNSGKCVIQGKGAEEWVTFTLEPEILGEARLGYEQIHNPDRIQPHMGIDESGKGDFFGPIVVAAVYVDPGIVEIFDGIGVRDSKRITSDRKAEELAKKIIEVVGNRFSVVEIGPRAYNRLYDSMGNVNKLLAWGHARAIEDLLEKTPECPRALSDKFGPEYRIKQALMKKGKSIKLEQKTKAESDPAVAAASIIARARFLQAMKKLSHRYDTNLPKGASDKVKEAAVHLIRAKGPAILVETSKTHFRTTDDVLAQTGHDRNELEAQRS